MNKNSLIIIILILVAAVTALILTDFSGDKPDKRGKNPYEYNVDTYKTVAEDLIHYRETKNIPFGKIIATALCIHENALYVAGDNFLQVLKPDGTQLLSVPIGEGPTCIHANADNIIVGFEKNVSVFDHQGNLMHAWEIPESKTVITSLTSKGNTIYVADAGNRRVMGYSFQGERQLQFE